MARLYKIGGRARPRGLAGRGRPPQAAARRLALTTVAAVRYQHVMADRDAAIARELNRLIEGT
jgi:hypothetical protein